jgi:thioredoxin-like negative regulator of GroEL
MSLAPVTEVAALAQAIAEHEAVWVLFGGAHCGVCQVIKPQLEQAMAARLPLMKGFYVDAAASPAVSAQASVFSLPVVRAYIDGQLTLEAGKAFSVGGWVDALARPYALRFGST